MIKGQQRRETTLDEKAYEKAFDIYANSGNIKLAIQEYIANLPGNDELVEKISQIIGKGLGWDRLQIAANCPHIVNNILATFPLFIKGKSINNADFSKIATAIIDYIDEPEEALRLCNLLRAENHGN